MGYSSGCFDGCLTNLLSPSSQTFSLSLSLSQSLFLFLVRDNFMTMKKKRFNFRLLLHTIGKATKTVRKKFYILILVEERQPQRRRNGSYHNNVYSAFWVYSFWAAIKSQSQKSTTTIQTWTLTNIHTKIVSYT